MEHLKKAESLPFPSSSATRTVSGWPLKINCANGADVTSTSQTSNIVTYDIVDTDGNGAWSIDDTFSVSYTACTLGTSTIQIIGSTRLKLDAFKSSSSNPNSGSITLGYSNFSITDTSTGASIGFNGGMTMAYTYDGNLFSASMTGASFTVTDSLISGGGGSVTFTNFNLISSASATPSIFTYSADMSISMTPTGGTTGTVNISTPVTFSGPVGGNPTSGQMRIDGANGSYITITAGSTTVTIVVFDGTTTTTTTKPWDQI